jgi:hypothetical protein
MKFIVVLSFDCMPDNLPDILKALDPPNLPYFDGEARVAVDDPNGEKVASKVIRYLDQP